MSKATASRKGLVALLVALWLGAALSSTALLGGCAGEAPTLETSPTADEAQRAKEAEERRKAEAEAQRQAEERRVAEERRQAVELREAFGPIGEPPSMPGPSVEVQGQAQGQTPATAAQAGAAGAAPAGPATGGERAVPFDEAVPPLPQEPQVRVAVFSSDADPAKARNVALIIGTYERDRLEERLGMAVKIAYVASAKGAPAQGSEIRYRPEFLRAAQSIAAVLSAEQSIGPMTPDERRQEGVDLVVYVSESYR